MEQVLNNYNLPMWVAIAVVLLYTIKKTVVPTVESLINTRKVIIQELEHEIAKLKLEKEKLELEIAHLKEKHNIEVGHLNEKYSFLKERFISFRSNMKAVRLILQENGNIDKDKIDNLFDNGEIPE